MARGACVGVYAGAFGAFSESFQGLFLSNPKIISQTPDLIKNPCF